MVCLLETSDAADDSLRVNLGGRRFFHNRLITIHKHSTVKRL